MKWSGCLYVSPAMEKRKINTIWRINHRAGTFRTYVLVMPMDNQNQLEIINAKYLKQKYYFRRNMVIIGIAESEESIQEIFMQIAEETYRSTGSLNIKEYLLNKMTE